jgi:hypothetical protein
MASMERASELKQQAAIDAAQDPNSPVTAAQAARAVVEEARKGGSAAYTFDPHASPEEKAAQAKAVCMDTSYPRQMATLTCPRTANPKQLPPRAQPQCCGAGLGRRESRAYPARCERREN